MINGESTTVPPALPNPSRTGGNTRIPSAGERPTEIHGLSEENGGGASQPTAGGQLANRNGATETVVLNPGATGGLQALRIGGRELPITQTQQGEFVNFSGLRTPQCEQMFLGGMEGGVRPLRVNAGRAEVGLTSPAGATRWATVGRAGELIVSNPATGNPAQARNVAGMSIVLLEQVGARWQTYDLDGNRLGDSDGKIIPDPADPLAARLLPQGTSGLAAGGGQSRVREQAGRFSFTGDMRPGSGSSALRFSEQNPSQAVVNVGFSDGQPPMQVTARAYLRLNPDRQDKGPATWTDILAVGANNRPYQAGDILIQCRPDRNAWAPVDGYTAASGSGAASAPGFQEASY
ncbi:MAG: hypothetical protein MO853_11165 [Candidatus Protistobacter heckmanni]|nr:hypothetical protein [Candidatus Protistobacter heckmanni]